MRYFFFKKTCRTYVSFFCEKFNISLQQNFCLKKICPSLSVTCGPRNYLEVKNSFFENQVVKTKAYSNLFQLLAIDNILTLPGNKFVYGVCFRGFCVCYGKSAETCLRKICAKNTKNNSHQFFLSKPLFSMVSFVIEKLRKIEKIEMFELKKQRI